MSQLWDSIFECQRNGAPTPYCSPLGVLTDRPNTVVSVGGTARLHPRPTKRFEGPFQSFTLIVKSMAEDCP
jgi:hypothetical protein